MTTEAQREAIDFFRSRGWNDFAAAGIVGNGVQESGQDLNPTLIHDNGTGFGAFGWRDPQPGVGRKTNLRRFAGERGLDVNDRMTQLMFVDHELNTAYSWVGSRLRNASSAREAATIFIDFEAPQGWSRSNPAGGHGYDNRVANAERALAFVTGKPVGEIRSPAAASAGLYDTPETGTGPYGREDVFGALSPANPAVAVPEHETDRYGLWDYMKATALEDTTASWLYQKMGTEEIPDDPEWRPTGDGLKEWQSRYSLPDRYLDEISSVRSQAELDRWGELFQESMKREEILSDFGVAGSLGRIVTTIVDPVAIGAAAVSEGALAPLVLASKIGRIGRIAARAALDSTMLAGETAVGAAVSPNMDSTDVAVAFGLGAVLGGTIGAIGRHGALKEEARTLANGGQRLLNAEPGGPSTIGAARNLDAPEFIMSDTPYIADADAPRAAFGGVRIDSVVQLGASENPLSRTVGAHLGEEVVGFTDKSLIVPHSAEARKLELSRSERTRWLSAVEPAFDEWVADRGFPWFERDSRRLEFMEQVSAAAEDRINPHLYHPAVQKAAWANQEAYGRFVDYLTNPGVLDGSTRRAVDGFDGLAKDAHYVPKYMDPARLAALGSRFSRDQLERFIAKAFQARLPELTDEVAGRFAKGYYTNLSKAAIGMGDDFDRAVAAGSRERLEEVLNDMGIEEADRAEIRRLIAPKEDGGSSSRSMRRSPIDYGFSDFVRNSEGAVERVSMRDFFHRDAEWIFNRYVNELSGRVALARMQIRNPRTGELVVDGIATKRDFEKVKDWVRDIWQDRRALGKADPRVQRDLKNLDFLYDNLVGVPHYDRSSPAWQWARRLRDFNFVRLMNNTGIYQAQELLAVPFKVGFKAALQQMPGVKAVGRALLDGHYLHKDQLTRELQIMGGQGADEWLNAERLRYLDETVGESFGERRIDRFGRAADNTLSKAKQITSKLSFLHTATSAAQTWTMRATAQRFADIAAAGGKLSSAQVKRMAQLGLSEADVRAVAQEMRKHSKSAADGSQLHSLNMEAWDPEARSKFVTALFRWSRRVIQENDLGSTARWMTSPGAQVLLQFRGFMMNAYAKQFLYSLHNLDGRTLVGLAGSAIAGGLGYAGTEYVKSLGAEDAKKYREGKLSIDRLLMGAIGRMPESAILPMLFDSTAGIVVGAQFGNVRASGQPSDLLFGNPTFGIVDEVAKFATAMRRSVAEDRPMSQQELQAGYRLLPFANWLPAATLFSHLIQDRRPTTPRPPED